METPTAWGPLRVLEGSLLVGYGVMARTYTLRIPPTILFAGSSSRPVRSARSPVLRECRVLPTAPDRTRVLIHPGMYGATEHSYMSRTPATRRFGPFVWTHRKFLRSRVYPGRPAPMTAEAEWRTLLPR